MNSTKNTLLQIPYPTQHGIVCESDHETASSIFADVYQGAAMNVSTILEKNELFQKNTPTEQDINTVIAFVGGRGTGKSSAMHSFRQILKSFPRREQYPWMDETISKKINSATFFSLPVIDASQISQSESIIGRISASMRDEYKKCSDKLPLETKRAFLEAIKDVTETAVMIRESEPWFRVNDALPNNIARVGNMPHTVKKLINSYLKFVMPQVNNPYLVISIDDLDMSTDNAYPIMEEIRKYLCIPRVIVLVSIDSKLLDTVLRSRLYQSLRLPSNASGVQFVPDDARIVSDDIRAVNELSYRYLEKLFPVIRRHHMPVLSTDQMKTWRCRIDTEFNIATRTTEEQCVTSVVLNLIQRKTMLILLCNKSGDHLLIPRNLRSLCNIVAFLRDMPDIEVSTETRNYSDWAQDKNTRNQLAHNLNLFKYYIANNIRTYGAPQINTESDQRMAVVLEKIIQQLPDIPVPSMNSLIVGDILYSVNSKKNVADTYFRMFHKVIGKEANGKVVADQRYDLLSPAIRCPDSISVGDVMYVLGQIDTRSNCPYVRYLVEIIRVLWSIRMTYEYFINGVNKDHNIVDCIGITEDFRTAVGGFFINPDVFPQHEEPTGLTDWIRYSDAKEKFGEYVAKLMVVSTFEKELPPPKTAWRLHRSNGKSYYRNLDHFVKEEEDTWCHPMALFTNLLCFPEKGLRKHTTISNWQKNNGMILPFYSMDFLYRYFEEIHNSLRLRVHPLPWLSLKELIEEKKDNLIPSQNSSPSITKPKLAEWEDTYIDLTLLANALKIREIINSTDSQNIDKYRECLDLLSPFIDATQIEKIERVLAEAPTTNADLTSEIENLIIVTLISIDESQANKIREIFSGSSHPAGELS